jgi:hypothetical protein
VRERSGLAPREIEKVSGSYGVPQGS